VTMKNVPITAGFVVIAATQLAVGIWLIILAAEGGGEAQPRTWKNYVSFRVSVCSSTVPTNTPRCIPFLFDCAAQTHRNRVHKHPSRIRYVRITPNMHLMVLILTDPCDNMYTPDFFAFSLIIFLAVKSRVANLRGPTLLETIAEDATLYFLVIFGSHLALEFTLTLGRVSATPSTTANDVQRL